MAAVIKLTDFTPQQVATIIECLTLQPIDPQAEKMKKYGKFKRHTIPKPPILMYQMTEDKQHVRLPYRFACNLLGKMLNQDKPHVKVIHEQKPSFEATLREYQIEPAKEAMQYLFHYGTTTIGLPPGWGKTVIGAWLWYLAGYVGLVFVHRDTIARQWIKTFSTCVPGIADKIWMVGEGSVPAEGTVPAVIICMDGRYEYIPEYIRKAIGFLIIDEGHLFCTPDRAPQAERVTAGGTALSASTGCLLSLEPRYVVVETATLERDDGMHSMMHALAGLHGTFRVSNAPYYVIAIDTGVVVDEVATKMGTSYGELCKELGKSELRNYIILDITLQNLHHKFIVLSQCVPHVELLETYYKTLKIKCDTLYRNKSTYSDSSVLIGTMPKVGTGFDEAMACADFAGVKSNVLIMCHSVKKWQLFEQLRGRVMRSDFPIVVWLNDKNKMPRNHLRGLEAWIQHTNGKIIPIQYAPGTIRLPALPVKKAAPVPPTAT